MHAKQKLDHGAVLWHVDDALAAYRPMAALPRLLTDAVANKSWALTGGYSLPQGKEDLVKSSCG